MNQRLVIIIKWLFSHLDLVILVILSFSIPLFFYKLGQSSLVSWDEAWYASISQNILKTGDVLHLYFNGELFADKPPGGMWITAIIFKLFGISNLTARLFPAVSGVLCLYLLYLLGTKLFNRLVGFCASVSLLSSFWFLYRARSGNLDIPLTLFYLLTVYLAIEASEKKKFIIPFIVSFGYLALIKGVVFMLILLPVVLIIFWKNRIYKVKEVIAFLLLSCGIFGSWILLQAMADPAQAIYHFSHSLRDSSLKNDYLQSFSLFREYLHSGIGKWFWPGILGVTLGLLFRQKRFLILSGFFGLYSLPYLFSSEIGTWHLIPLYPFMILAFYGIFYELSRKILNVNIFRFSNSYRNILVHLLLLGFSFYFAVFQIRMAWYQFIDIPAYISDEEILSKEAGRNVGKIYLDGNFDPAGAFYSGREVQKLDDPNINNLFAGQEDFLLITNDWRLEQAKLDFSGYVLLKKDRDKVLIQRLLSR